MPGHYSNRHLCVSCCNSVRLTIYPVRCWRRGAAGRSAKAAMNKEKKDLAALKAAGGGLFEAQPATPRAVILRGPAHPEAPLVGARYIAGIKQLVSVDRRGRMKVWDVDTGEEMHRFRY